MYFFCGGDQLRKIRILLRVKNHGRVRIGEVNYEVNTSTIG